MSIFDKVKGAAKTALQKELDVFQFLKLLTPFDITFALAIRANVKTSDGKKHDFGVYIKPLDDTNFFLKDMQALVTQLVYEIQQKKQTGIDWRLGRAIIGEKEYIAIYLNKQKEK